MIKDFTSEYINDNSKSHSIPGIRMFHYKFYEYTISFVGGTGYQVSGFIHGNFLTTFEVAVLIDDNFVTGMFSGVDYNIFPYATIDEINDMYYRMKLKKYHEIVESNNPEEYLKICKIL